MPGSAGRLYDAGRGSRCGVCIAAGRHAEKRMRVWRFKKMFLYLQPVCGKTHTIETKLFKTAKMPVKIRLSRHGKKGYAFYHIVVADSRAPRDGKFIEKIGVYNPNTNPASIDLDFEKALNWLQKGAQPTDTCKSILSYKGVLYKKHLLGGVAKGAFSEGEAETRFQKWLNEKAARITAKTNKIAGDKQAVEKARLAEESKIKEERAKAVAAKRAEAAAAAAAAAAPAEETAAEAPAAEGEAPAEA